MAEVQCCCCSIYEGLNVEQSREAGIRWYFKVKELLGIRYKCNVCLQYSQKLAKICGYPWDEKEDGNCCCGRNKVFNEAMQKMYEDQWNKYKKHTCLKAEPYPCGCDECPISTRILRELYKILSDFILSYKMEQMNMNTSAYDPYWTPLLEEIESERTF